MLVAEIPEQTGPDVEQKLKTKSGGEFEVPGGVPRGARARGPQFTPPQRFATFALRLQPFASEFRDGAPVCSENDAFPERKGDLNFATEHRSAAKTMPGSGDAGTRAEISVSLQTGARSPVACSPVGIEFGSSLDRVGTELGSSWNRTGIELGSNWVRIGIELASSWDRIGIELG